MAAHRPGHAVRRSRRDTASRASSTPPPRFEKPLLAAVNGLGVGIGLTVLLHCDLALIADTARLRAPFVPLGVVPEAAGSLLMPVDHGQPARRHSRSTPATGSRRRGRRRRPRARAVVPDDGVADDDGHRPPDRRCTRSARSSRRKKLVIASPHRRGPGRAGARRRHVRAHGRRRAPTREALSAFLEAGRRRSARAHSTRPRLRFRP